jgi:hypothetical protein
MLKVHWCEGAEESFRLALDRASSGNRKRKLILRKRVDSYIARICSQKRLAKSSFCKEGELPGGGDFYAIKKIPIRLYCWFGKNQKGTLFISHAIYKDQNKLSPADVDRVAKSFRTWDVP